MFDPVSLGIMLAGAAITAKTQNDAAKRAQRQALLAQQRQLAARNQATDVAMKRVQEFDPTARADKQQEIATDLTQQFDQSAQGTPVTAQGVQVGTTIPGGTTDYLTAKAREKAKTAESLRNLAQLMGRMGSTSELRRGEAVRIGDTAGEIGRIQTGANNMAGIDELAINAAGQPSVGGMILGQALSAYGAGSLAKSGLGAAKGAAGSYANPDLLKVTNLPSWN